MLNEWGAQGFWAVGGFGCGGCFSGVVLATAVWGFALGGAKFSLLRVPPLGEIEARGAKSASPAIETRGFGGWPPDDGAAHFSLSGD
ncbi:hypothetical protein BB341_22050 [Streptomyces clavuligerus]|nr:hypothetical protein BB341_22050 [Streptomyces clavuligerus]AXU15323.1 hypothetical protein D1794_22935 [Streptomyces clavuligerus]QCS08099.1 hypothetical protein CRV15_22300 [Streptomyces clavuligerus]